MLVQSDRVQTVGEDMGTSMAQHPCHRAVALGSRTPSLRNLA